MEKFANGKVRARKYRNRRIGELFKEIDLSEKQGTGISKILRELKKNNSPAPIFDTDEDRTYLETTILMRDGFENAEMSKSMSELMSKLMSQYLSKLESERMNTVYDYFINYDSFTSTDVADYLLVEVKTSSRLLNKAEKIGVLESKGNTKAKRYKFKKID